MKEDERRMRTRAIIDIVYFDPNHLSEWILVRANRNVKGFEEIVGFGKDRLQIVDALKRDQSAHSGCRYVLYEPTVEEGVRLGTDVFSIADINDKRFTPEKR